MLVLVSNLAFCAEEEGPLDPQSTDDITLALARLAVETTADEIPEQAYEAAQAALLDALGCAYAGHDAPGVPIVIQQTTTWGGRPEATVWFDGTKVPAPAAAFANSVQLHALDFDDYHPPSDAHITSVLVPTVLAMGETNKASGKETLAALIVGTEVIGRLGRAYKKRRAHSGFLPTSVIGGFGSTAAACHLHGCSVEQTVNAMGVWYAHCAGNRQALFDRTLTKRIQPGIAAQAGVFATFLAAAGMTGPTRIAGRQGASLTQSYGCRRDAKPPSVAELMTPYATWQIEQLHFKRYACCGVCGRAIEAAKTLAARHKLKPGDIKEIRLFGDDIHSPFGAVAWGNAPLPHVVAQFCVPYAAASAIKNACYGPQEIAPDRIAEDREVDALARRTRMCEWDQWEGTRPRARTGMQIFLTDGRKFEATCDSFQRYRWPEDRDQLTVKLKKNLAFSKLADEPAAEQLISAVKNLRACRNIAMFVRQQLVPERQPTFRNTDHEGNE